MGHFIHCCTTQFESRRNRTLATHCTPVLTWYVIRVTALPEYVTLKYY